ncbi:MauE/DoxX family redox-associated membrane protein [Geomonas subterranea]|uniref:MauE/DoxX family redox-associated membrane protein n=1 Tax=Geomonas subterranea TaxID=2847989 RepID=UPI00384CE9BD
MKGMRSPILPLALRVALGAVFIYAAIPKIADPVAFAGSVAAYRILPYFWSYLTAAVLPFLELVCGVLLICGIRVRSGALIIGMLNLVFMVALASAMIRGLDIDCGCFRQDGSKTAPWVALVRDALFLLMTAVVLRHERLQARCPLPQSAPPPPAGE